MAKTTKTEPKKDQLIGKEKGQAELTGQSELEIREAECVALNQKVLDAEAANAELQAEIDGFRTGNSQLRVEAGQAKKIAEEAEQANAELQAEIDPLRTANSQLTAELGKAEEKVHNALTALSERAASLKEANTNIEILQVNEKLLLTRIAEAGTSDTDRLMAIATIMGAAISKGDPTIADKAKCARASCEAYDAMTDAIAKRYAKQPDTPASE